MSEGETGRARPDEARVEALEQAAGLIAERPPEAWDGWIVQLLKELDQRTSTEDFHRVLEALQADIASRLVQGHW
jgi:hypothetical protein